MSTAELIGAEYVSHKDNRDHRTTFDPADTRYKIINLPRYSALRQSVTFVPSQFPATGGAQTKTGPPGLYSQ
jgi:hypothetical protein